jgi:hypothetical protein
MIEFSAQLIVPTNSFMDTNLQSIISPSPRVKYRRHSQEGQQTLRDFNIQAPSPKFVFKALLINGGLNATADPNYQECEA